MNPTVLPDEKRHAKRTIMIVSAIALAIAAGVLFVVGHYDHEARHPSGESRVTNHASRLYTCPMHPSYQSDKPGTCPICGMDLVPVQKEPKLQGPGGGEKDARTAIMLDNERQQRIGVTTAEVTKGPAIATIRASGRVAFDADLTVAQREFLEARRVGDQEIVRASRQRLALMGMGKDEIDQLARRGKPDANLVLPAAKAWIYASVYERELPQVAVGEAAAIELPDGTSAGIGTVRAIDPAIDPQTRTARARIEVDHAGGLLKPNMFVTAILKQDLGEQLLVPASAVIDSGTRKIVFVVHEGLHFLPRDIELGPELSGNYVVKSGLSAGDVVATAALFLIDSESRLKAAAQATGGHAHD